MLDISLELKDETTLTGCLKRLEIRRQDVSSLLTHAAKVHPVGKVRLEGLQL